MTSAFSLVMCILTWQNSCFILYSKAKFASYSRCFLTSYFCIPAPMMKMTILGVLFLEGLVGLHWTLQFQLLQHYWSGIELDYCDIEWFALEIKSDHSSFLSFCPSTSFQTLR